jgi:hypothetical protein
MTISDRSRSNTPEAPNGQILRRDHGGNSRYAEPHEVGAPAPNETSDTALPASDYVDTNNRLVDELERILHGDFADGPDSHDVMAGDFPLAGGGFGGDLDEETAPFAPAGFWETKEPFIEEPGLSDEPIDRMPIGRFTVATILLMVVAGGTYAYVQLTGDPVLPLSGGTEIAAASPLGGAPVEAEAVVDEPDPVAIDPNEAGHIAELEDAPVAEFEPAVATLQPRLVRTAPITAPTAEAANAAAVDPTPETNELAGLGGPPAEPDPTPMPAKPLTAEAGFDPAGAAPPTTVARSTTVVTTNDWVNLRAGPDNDAAVIQTVPFGAELQLIGCDPWCEVYYEGTHGWIWRDFINATP